MKRILAFVLAALMCLTVLAGCGPTKDGLQSAKEYLDTVMKDKSENTPADYDLLDKVVIAQKDVYTITWSVNVTEGVKIVVAEDGKVTVDVNERTEVEIPYVLTATIKDADGKTITATYNRKVPIFKELTWAEFTATAEDAPVVIRGIITGIVNTSTKHELYLEDNDGGYYVYNLDEDEMEGLEIGMEVRVSGIRDAYYGVNQVVEASVEIMNEELHPVTPTDVTEQFLAATNMKDAALAAALQSKLVCIKNVTILGQDPSDPTYFNFSIGEPVGAKKSYVRLSTSACMLSSADQTTFKNNVENNLGMGATVTGIVSLYNNAIYFIPVTVDAFADFATVERTPAEQVEFEKTLMDAIGTITQGGTIDLATKGKIYDGVQITWAMDGTSAYATLSGNKLTVPVLPDEDQTVKLIATIKNGDATTTKEFTVKIAAAPRYVPDVVTPEAGTKYKFVIKQFQTKQTLYLANFENNKLNVTTDYTKAVDVGIEPVAGKDGHFYLYYYVGEAKAYITVSVIDDKATIGTARAVYEDNNTYTYNATYDTLMTTVVEKDDDGNDEEVTYWFGTYNKNADYMGISKASYLTATSYNSTNFPAHFATILDTTTKTDAEKVEREKNDLTIDTKFDAAGTVTLPAYGSLFVQATITWAVDPADTTGAIVIEGNTLKAVPQSDESTVKVIATIKHGTASATKEFTVKVAKKAAISIKDAIELEDGTGVMVMGTVTEIKDKDAWSDKFGNMSVTITDINGDKLYIFRMSTKVELGDFIIVSGKMTSYYETRQIAQGATAEIVGKNAISIEEAEKLTDGTDVEIKGTVTEIKSAWSEQFGNMEVYITDADGKTILVYRIKTKVELGDIIVVSGKMGSYKGTKQIAQGSTAVVVGKSAPEAVTIAEAIALEDGTKVVIKATVSEIKSAWSEQFGNMDVIITDETGTLTVFRLATKVNVGDVITVTGVMATYKENRQIGQGATAEIETAA